MKIAENMVLGLNQQSEKIKNFPWREGVEVEPTQDLSQPHAGFADQEAL